MMHIIPSSSRTLLLQRSLQHIIVIAAITTLLLPSFNIIINQHHTHTRTYTTQQTERVAM